MKSIPQEHVSQKMPGLKKYAWLEAGFWAMSVLAILMVSLRSEHSSLLEAARNHGRALINRDVMYRRWSSGHGGVYVPISDSTPPNPYLDVKERDITTPSGRVLTLVNPAYMTRQVHELGLRDYGVHSHITSLKPIRPENKADAWETEALERMAQGESEVSSIELIGGRNHLRLMHPLVTEQGCMKCHQPQGYSVGDIRGGISVAVPLDENWPMDWASIGAHVIGHAFLLLIGLAGIGWMFYRLRGNVRSRIKLEREFEVKLLEQQKLAAVGTLARGAAHEINNPINGIMNYAELIKDAGSTESETEDFANEIIGESHRVAAIVRGLQTFAANTEEESRSLPVGELIDPVVDELSESLSEDSIVLKINIPDDLPVIVCQPSRIQVLIENLIRNAQEALNDRYPNGHDDKVINVSAGMIDEGDGLMQRLTVEDHGAGFSEDVRARLFEPFFTTRDRSAVAGGVARGLGLAIARNAAGDSRGRLTAECRIEEWTRFHLDLPVKHIAKETNG